MGISRRRLIGLGASSAAGLIASGMATPASAAAFERLPGVHISVLTRGVSDDSFKDYPYRFCMTVYGADDALNGMGWGGATDLETQQDTVSSRLLQSLFSLAGGIDGDVVKLHGLVLFSPDQGQQSRPLTFEAHLTTGFVRYRFPDGHLVFEGTGVVARI